MTPIIEAFVVFGLLWLALEYRGIEGGFWLLAAYTVFKFVGVEERFAGISKLLERHSKQIFPHLYRDDD